MSEDYSGQTTPPDPERAMRIVKPEWNDCPPVPVLLTSPGSHDRHDVLMRLWTSVRDSHGDGHETMVIMYHAAQVLLACECAEGAQLRVAVRTAAGVSPHSGCAVRVGCFGDSPRIAGKKGYTTRRRSLAEMTSQAWGISKKHAYVPSTYHVVVGAAYVLHLAGWPAAATGVVPHPVQVVA